VSFLQICAVAIPSFCAVIFLQVCAVAISCFCALSFLQLFNFVPWFLWSGFP